MPIIKFYTLIQDYEDLLKLRRKNIFHHFNWFFAYRVSFAIRWGLRFNLC